MDSTVRIEVAGANVNPQGNAGATKSGAGFGKVVMFGTVPGILLGAAGISAAAYAVSDDFDAVVDDFKDAASDILGSNEAAAPEVNVNPEQEAAEESEVVTEVEDVTASVAETLPVAEVSDEMSFGSAFAAARSQVGAEGVFEWRGNYYSTYTKEEWDAMDADARGEYMQKYYETDMNAETDMETETEEVVEAHEVAENMTVSSDVVFGQTEGHDTMFVDADGDGAADYMVVDVNDDGEAGYDEIHDVSDEGIMMSDLG